VDIVQVACFIESWIGLWMEVDQVLMLSTEMVAVALDFVDFVDWYEVFVHH
jgi:hypothetical protein